MERCRLPVQNRGVYRLGQVGQVGVYLFEAVQATLVRPADFYWGDLRRVLSCLVVASEWLTGRWLCDHTLLLLRWLPNWLRLSYRSWLLPGVVRWKILG